MSFDIAAAGRRAYIGAPMPSFPALDSPSAGNPAPPGLPSALTTLYEVLYVSQLAPDTPVSAVASIAGHARTANAQRGLTGLLVFDGQRFCQQLEGSQKQVLSAMARICQDPRHVEINVVHQGLLDARRFSSFSLAFSEVEGGDVLEQMEQLDGAAALRVFETLRASVLL